MDISPALHPFPCKLCDKRFVSTSKLQLHIRTTHANRKPHPCLFCGKNFPTSSSLVLHIRVHTTDKQCTDDNTSASSSGSESRMHSLAHACDESVNSPSQSIVKRKYSDVDMLKCDVCDKYFTRSTDLTIHSATHSEEKCTPISNEVRSCSSITNPAVTVKNNASSVMRDRTRVKLGKHESKIYSENPYECETCGNVYSQLGRFRKHNCSRNKEHNHRCKKCKKVYLTVRDLLTHSKRCHALVKKKFECNICGKLFTFASSAKVHFFTHTGEKHSKCDICGKEYGQPHHLKEHLYKHTGERPHPCNICGKRFFRLQDLNKHFLRHISEGRYKCTLCSQHFLTARKLTYHYKLDHVDE